MNEHTTRDGVDTAALIGALDAVKAQLEAAKFQFRAANRWVKGTHSRSTINELSGFGAEQMHRAASSFEADRPEQLVGSDQGPSPAE